MKAKYAESVRELKMKDLGLKDRERELECRQEHQERNLKKMKLEIENAMAEVNRR